MSEKQLKRPESGFTLIEVTLAIVIGVVVIAGATVLYNQAKNSAANSAAQNKVNAASAIVEEFAARNYGNYPTGGQLEKVWIRNRPDDFNTSPWGGMSGIASSGIMIDGAFGDVADEIVNASGSGTIEYRRSSSNATASIWDNQIENTKIVRGYSLWIYNGAGEGPHFVTGGK
jgi:prepilin-type N-terminal cleavage/methylation domain-containing protein